jgi:LmbE family N-acetylglucosaminyl deacetylase
MNYLFVAAHLDDIELAAGGLITRLTSKGVNVTMLVLSESDYSNWQGEILREKNQAIEEGIAAAKILGAGLEILDFPTKDIQYTSTVVEAIEKRIVNFNADVVFTHNVNDTHQSHISVAKATLSAARRIQSIFFYEPMFPSGRAHIPFNPNVYVDITDFLSQKVKSLKAHKSQFNKYSSKWLEAVIARARYRGYENNMQYAECFELCRMELKL